MLLELLAIGLAVDTSYQVFRMGVDLYNAWAAAYIKPASKLGQRMVFLQEIILVFVMLGGEQIGKSTLAMAIHTSLVVFLQLDLRTSIVITKNRARHIAVNSGTEDKELVYQFHRFLLRVMVGTVVMISSVVWLAHLGYFSLQYLPGFDWYWQLSPLVLGSLALAFVGFLASKRAKRMWDTGKPKNS